MKPTTQRHGITFTLSTIASAGTVIAMFWLLLKPLVVDAVADELKTEMQQTVASQIEPTNIAFAVVLRGQIRATRRQIASLEYRRDSSPQEWTEADAQDLAQAKADLVATQTALTALEQTARSR